MTSPHLSLVRRAVNTLAALLTLAAPVTPMVHAAAMERGSTMGHDHVACDHAPATSHHTGTPGHPAHQHDGSCCDFCGTCGTAPAIWTGTTPAITALSVELWPAPMAPLSTITPSRPPYSLPLPLGPPALLA
ncbi:MAG TPA: hypothetical protein VGL65_03000 [Gemmatimonadales bacterium]